MSTTATTVPTTTASPAVAVPTILAHLVAGDTTSYVAAPTGDKTRTRTALNAELVRLMTAGDFNAAAEVAKAIRSLPVASATKVAAEPVNYERLVAVRIATLRAAADALASGTVTPEGLPEGTTLDLDAVTEHLVTADETDEDLVNEDTMKRLASAKVSRSAVRNSIEGVIERAFEGAEPGTFLTVAQIRAAGSTEDYRPSDGAIAARLFPKSDKGCTLVGVEPVDATANSPRGARLV